MYALSLRLAFVSAVVSCAFAIPFMAHAQQSDLQTTIRAALAGDPRTAGMSPTQIDAMVNVLTAQAQKQGVTPGDITWRPVTNVPAAVPADTCGSMPSMLCALNTAFGFDGSDNRIPWGLGISSLLLMFILAALLERHHLQVVAMRTANVIQ